MGIGIQEGNESSAYGFYGSRQEEFSYLADTNQREIIEYCHAIGNLMNYAKGETGPKGVFATPDVVSRMRLQYDAQSRIMDRLADEIEADLPDTAATAAFRRRFISIRAEIEWERGKW